MSLLDSDAEELKARAGATATSGRKTNQSGLGALKSLSKYSNLTAKYRATQATKAEPSPAVADTPTVEHSRGTIYEDQKSVQSQATYAPTLSYKSTVLNNNSAPEVGASLNPLQMPEVSATMTQSQCSSEPAALEPSILNSNQCSDKVSADNNFIAKNFDKGGSKSIPAQDIDIEKAVVRSNQDEHSQCKVSADDDSFLLKAKSKGLTGVIESQYISSPTLVSNGDLMHLNLANKVGAGQNPLNDLSVEIKTVQSQCTAAPALDTGADDLSFAETNKTTKVSAKSVQHKKQLSAKVGANSGQSPCEVSSEVGAKIKTLEDEFLLPIESALTVVGSQKTILDFIYDQCVWNQGLVTGPITKVQLIEATKLNEETALSAIKRLRKKRMIDRHSYKDGKAGWTKYRLAELSYKEILTFRQNYQSSYLLAQQSQGKVRSEVSASSPSKIDSNLNIITNYTSAPTSAPTYFNSWFKTLNFKPVHPINPMQVNSSIRRLVEERLEQDDAQNFINRFMTWLSGQGKVNSPIAIFCDKFKEYANEGDSAILYVKTQEEIHMEHELAQKTEKMRQEIELIEKAKAFEKSKQDDENFENWYLSATDDELLQLQQPNSFVEFKSEIYKKSIKGIYLEKYFSAN